MERIGKNIIGLARLIIRFLEEKSKEYGISGAQGRTLLAINNLIKKKEYVYPKDLEETLNKQKSSICEILQTLEKNQLIKRITNQDNTHYKYIVLTDKSLDIIKKVQEDQFELEEVLLKNIDREERKSLLNFTKLMIENMGGIYEE